MTGKLAGVVGWPVSQSLSPLMHNYWLRQYGIEGTYIALPIAPENFSLCLGALPLMGFAGVNVTVPHKQAAFSIANSLDEDARTTQAVNFLTFRDGQATGANSDVRGFGESLKQTFPLEVLNARPVVVLGAGGAARGVVLALQQAGFHEIRIVNRTRQRADLVAGCFTSKIRCRAMDWGDWSNAFSGTRLLVNTTSLGMIGKPPLDLPLRDLPADAAVADIVYNPVQTVLLRSAVEAGHPVMDGLGMLMHQAVAAFAAWFGVEPAVTPELRSVLLQALARV